MKNINGKDGKSGPVRGAGASFFGFVLVSTGLLNTMLSLKAGQSMGLFSYLPIILGAVFILAGLGRSR